jgi:hypothetical protein
MRKLTRTPMKRMYVSTKSSSAVDHGKWMTASISDRWAVDDRSEACVVRASMSG